MGRRSPEGPWAGEAEGKAVLWGLALKGSKSWKVLELVPGNKTNWFTAKCGTGFWAHSLVVQAEPRALHPAQVQSPLFSPSSGQNRGRGPKPCQPHPTCYRLFPKQAAPGETQTVLTAPGAQRPGTWPWPWPWPREQWVGQWPPGLRSRLHQVQLPGPSLVEQ